jgi:response regulator NasT
VNNLSECQDSAVSRGFPNLIMLIDTEETRRSILGQGLINSGYQLVPQSKTAIGLIESVIQNKPNLIVMGSPDKVSMNNLLMLKTIHPTPVVVFAEDEAPRVIQQAMQAGVCAYIVNAIQPHRLKSIVTVAYARFLEQQKLSTELVKVKSALANRKVVEKAKGLLMHKKCIAEEEAFNLIRKMSMNKRLPVVQVAADIIEVLELVERVELD